jgi:hypothetical protein
MTTHKKIWLACVRVYLHQRSEIRLAVVNGAVYTVPVGIGEIA